MTKQLWTVIAFGALTWTVSVGAQSRPATLGEALAAQYVNAETGLSLDEAITRALGQEPTLRAARTEIDVAKGVQRQAGLRPNPTVFFMQQQEAGGTDNQSRVDMQWPLDLFRKTGRVAVAEQQVKATERSVLDRERTLAADVRLKYGEAVVAVRDLTVSDDLVATTVRQLDLVRARVEQGATPPLERNMVEVELRRLEADQLLQAGRVDQAVVDLKRVLGMPSNMLLQLRDTLEQLVARNAAAPMIVDPGAVPNRPDVQEAETRIRVADAQIDRARREGRYDLSLFSSYMRMDAGFPQLGLNEQGQLTRVRGIFHDISAGAMVTVPLRNQNQGAIASARAERAGAAERLKAAQLTAEAEIAAAAARDARARAAMAVYSGGARDLARQNLDVVRQTYELGRATVFDVLTEQRRYLDLERAYSAALREAYEARTSLRRALGDVQ